MKGRLASPFIPLMSTHPGLPVLLASQNERHCSGGQSPGRVRFWHCVGEKWGQVFLFWGGIFSFLPKKNKKKKREKIYKRSIELLQLGQDGKDCGRPHTDTHSHTHTHVHSCMSRSGPQVVSTLQNQTFSLFIISLNRENQSGLVYCIEL